MSEEVERVHMHAAYFKKFHVSPLVTIQKSALMSSKEFSKHLVSTPNMQALKLIT